MTPPWTLEAKLCLHKQVPRDEEGDNPLKFRHAELVSASIL
jgi:hypothetical protein